MRHSTLAEAGFQRYSKRTRGVRGVQQWVWSACCGFTFCSTGSTSRTLRWKKRFMIPVRCVNSWASTSAGGAGRNDDL